MTETQIPPQAYVGFWARLAASLIDSLALIAVSGPLLYLIYGRQYWASAGGNQGSFDIFITWVFPVVATILFWLYKSATPGKMVVKAKVVDVKTGNALSIGQSIIRYVGYYLSLLPCGLGFFWIAWDGKKQGWHDKLAGTVVIRPLSPKSEKPN